MSWQYLFSADDSSSADGVCPLPWRCPGVTSLWDSSHAEQMSYTVPYTVNVKRLGRGRSGQGTQFPAALISSGIKYLRGIKGEKKWLKWCAQIMARAIMPCFGQKDSDTIWINQKTMVKLTKCYTGVRGKTFPPCSGPGTGDMFVSHKVHSSALFTY